MGVQQQIFNHMLFSESEI